MRTLEIGTVSHGTMRMEDLISAFHGALEDVDPDHPLLAELQQVYKDNPADDQDASDEWYDSEDAEYMLEELFDALDEHCPPYCYFGAHEGDGSDYGCWVSWEDVEEYFPAEPGGIKSSWGSAYRIARVNSGDPWPCVHEILEVNDHGNMTLWTWDAEEHRHVEAWSIV